MEAQDGSLVLGGNQGDGSLDSVHSRKMNQENRPPDSDGEPPVAYNSLKITSNKIRQDQSGIRTVIGYDPR